MLEDCFKDFLKGHKARSITDELDFVDVRKLIFHIVLRCFDKAAELVEL